MKSILRKMGVIDILKKYFDVIGFSLILIFVYCVIAVFFYEPSRKESATAEPSKVIDRRY